MLILDMKRSHRLLGMMIALAIWAVPVAVMAQSVSPSGQYQVDEVFFGSGGEIEACSVSGQYCSQQSLGELTVGNAEGNLYGAQAGFNTTDEPLLEVAVSGNVDFGELSLDATRSGSAVFQVRSYLAHGYTVYLVGPAPSISNHTLAGMGSVGAPALATQGVEQFGVSLADTAPVQVPDNTFSYGAPLPPYDQPAAYAWPAAADETRAIAFSDRSSGQTNFTLSMIANMSNITPAGTYTTKLAIVAVPTF